VAACEVATTVWRRRRRPMRVLHMQGGTANLGAVTAAALGWRFWVARAGALPLVELIVGRMNRCWDRTSDAAVHTTCKRGH